MQAIIVDIIDDKWCQISYQSVRMTYSYDCHFLFECHPLCYTSRLRLIFSGGKSSMVSYNVLNVPFAAQVHGSTIIIS